MLTDTRTEFHGIRRIREILETHDWTTADADDDDGLEKELLGLGEEDGFNLEVNELQREMLGMSLAVGRGGGSEDNDEDEDQVESLEALMLRVKSIRGTFFHRDGKISVVDTLLWQISALNSRKTNAGDLLQRPCGIS